MFPTSWWLPQNVQKYTYIHTFYSHFCISILNTVCFLQLMFICTFHVNILTKISKLSLWNINIICKVFSALFFSQRSTQFRLQMPRFFWSAANIETAGRSGFPHFVWKTLSHPIYFFSFLLNVHYVPKKKIFSRRTWLPQTTQTLFLL